METANIIEHYENNFYIIDIIFEEFEKPLFENIFFKNLDILKLKQNYDRIKFSNNQWNVNPSKFCLDHYGNNLYDLYPVILLVNNIESYFEFDFKNIKEYIIAPKLNVIFDLCNYKYN